MKKKSEFFKAYYIQTIVIIFLIIVFGFKLFVPKQPEAIKSDTKILFQIDSLHLQRDIDLTNRTTLLNLLQEREAISINSIASSESVRMESRLFYCAIIAGLISLFFVKDENNKRKKLLSFLLLIIIILSYFVDVHQEDLIKRKISESIITSNAINQLVKPYDKTIYELSYDSVYAQYDKASELCGRWKRKVYNACSPDISQSVYYIVPLILFLIIFSKLIFSKKD